MHIKRVELENIKSHAASTFEFERGTTAITGENGAGKTTIIEAIAWVLFDLLSYKKDEFLRRGTKKGLVRVTFESGLDEREYTVYRDTGTGYYVYDPALQLRIADKKEEVTRFLWQHLGVEPGTDLESLFKHAIGVPQGTFTAIFLATTAERKRTFDTLLKVEEYRRGADELLKTSRFIDQQIGAVSIRIARSEGEIARIDPIEEERSRMAEQNKALSERAENLSSELTEKETLIAAFDRAESVSGTAKAELDSVNAENIKAQFFLSQAESEAARSKEAAARLADARPDAEKYSAAIGRLSELERERNEREKIREERSKIEAAEAKVTAEQKNLLNDLARIQSAHSQIESLKPLVGKQERLETEIGAHRNSLARAEAVEVQIKSLDDSLVRLRESYKTNSAILNEAREKAASAGAAERFQKRDIEIVLEVANLNASLERDETFQREIKNGLCPIFSAKCLNLKEGQTLDGFVTSQFGELRAKITGLQMEHAGVTSALGTSREAEKFLVHLPVLEAREQEIKDEGTRLNEEKAELEKGIAGLPELRLELNRVESELKTLDNPKTRIAFLEKESVRENEIRRELSLTEKNLERLERERRIVVERLESYKDLDAHWSEATTARDSTSDAYRAFIANEAFAGQLEVKENALAAARAELDAVGERTAAAQAAFESASKEYDRSRHLSERQNLVEWQKRSAELGATLSASMRREAELSAEIERLHAIRKAMLDEFREKERLEKVAETTDFIRTTLKEAAPLVARNYVYHVSLEANQMFREITGNAERTLKWAEDYGIILEEGGYDRPFVSLSGGEQMAAALSVRLALLKQLSDIRIAFFDEPTTNMDAERRDNLAQQISRIGHFEQLFVISHDDTFEGYMDNEIRVGE